VDAHDACALLQRPDHRRERGIVAPLGRRLTDLPGDITEQCTEEPLARRSDQHGRIDP
jgi:hypothetical protein